MLSSLTSFLGGPSSNTPQLKSAFKKSKGGEKRVRFKLSGEQSRNRPPPRRSSSPHPHFGSRGMPSRPSAPSSFIPTSTRPACPQRSHAPSSSASTTRGRPEFASHSSTTPSRPPHPQVPCTPPTRDTASTRGRAEFTPRPFTPRPSTPAATSLASRPSTRPSNAQLSSTSSPRVAAAAPGRPCPLPPSTAQILGRPTSTNPPSSRSIREPLSVRHAAPRHFRPSQTPLSTLTQLQAPEPTSLTSLLSSILFAPPPPPAPPPIPRPRHLIPAGNTLLDPVALHPERWRLWWTTKLPLQQEMEKFDEESRRMDLRMGRGGGGGGVRGRERVVRRVVLKRGEEWVETWAGK
ncbi:uncharacterized protein BDZ99DRAFT_129060 [Mytilinidion resinicola]|uniref:Uncharacterized protein n=1 Tax=Mytilinidion resinicola TaxID=574789 RepID=A0A6A6Z5V6_9PEZI|nr:uncharacterized protein BDZ99DRAFT_129060 [Mytilinidion resinicola]KAF2816109.1 hypothetical protein BDZ99DRAFT_129060 [Mytilinidion resinicola]